MKTLIKTILASCIITSCSQYESNTMHNEVQSDNVNIENKTSTTYVSVEEATDIASVFMDRLTNKNNKTRSTQSHPTTITLKDGNRASMYVINYPEGGFAVVSASKNYYPILAYSDEDSFDLSSNILGVENWIKNTKVSIASSESLNDSIKLEIHNLWESLNSKNPQSTDFTKASTRSGNLSEAEIACHNRCEELMNQAISSGHEGWYFAPLYYARQAFDEAGFSSIYQNLCYSADFNHSPLEGSVIGWKIITTRDKVGPLLTTKWGQRGPFNNLCNDHETGCGAIALAQVMKYHEYPNSFTFNGNVYDWSNIPSEIDSDSNQAALVKYVYNTINTSNLFGCIYTTPGNMEDGIEDLGFGLSTGDEDYMRVENEIMSGRRPVIMLGNDDNLSMLPSPLSYVGNSHYWVCDGGDRRTENKLLLFTEWQPYGNGTFVQGWNSIDQPYDFGGVTYLYFHMNWGWYGECNGWFFFNSTDSGNAYGYDDSSLDNSGKGDFEHSRTNFYISIPQ